MRKLDAADVETLRQAAALLDGTAAEHWSPGAIAEAKLTVAMHLRLLAQAHCDHGRVSADGTCRYCDAPVADEHQPKGDT